MITTALKQPRRTASKATRCRQLIEATIESIAEFGFSGTTVATITSRANLSIGTVNLHFKSKELLFTETLIFLAREHHDFWAKHLKIPGLTASEKLLSVVDAHFAL